MDIEIWKPYPPSPSKYVVSNYGRVMSTDTQCGRKDRIALATFFTDPTIRLHFGKRKSGDKLIRNRKCERIADMVLLTFAGPPPVEGYVAHFKDGDNTNLKIDNLEYGPNQRQVWRRSLTPEMVALIKLKLAGKERVFRIAAELGVSEDTISKINRGLHYKNVDPFDYPDVVQQYISKPVPLKNLQAQSPVRKTLSQNAQGHSRERGPSHNHHTESPLSEK